MLAAWFSDAVDAAVLLREIDEARFTEGPAPLLARLRARGAHAPTRSRLRRRWLASAIYRLDRALFSEPNCYRRTLVLMAMDAEAARQPLMLGLDVPDSGATGHAWVRGREAPPRYHVEFRL